MLAVLALFCVSYLEYTVGIQLAPNLRLLIQRGTLTQAYLLVFSYTFSFRMSRLVGKKEPQTRSKQTDSVVVP